MVPHIIHFIWLETPKSRPFSLVNMIAIEAAEQVQSPDRIIVHCNREPVDNTYWDSIRPLVQIKSVDVPTSYGGTPIDHVQYQADVLRLEILQAMGGIYLDTDLILLKPITDLLDTELTLVEESPNSIANAVIIAKPRSIFLERWLDHMPDALRSPIWAYHAVILPGELLASDPMGTKVLGLEAFFPLDLKKNYLFDSAQEVIEETERRMASAYGIHIYETYWEPILKNVDRTFMDTVDCIFTRRFRKYL